jgi:hypothetical protein
MDPGFDNETGFCHSSNAVEINQELLLKAAKRQLCQGT